MTSKYFHIRNIDGHRTNFLAFKILKNASDGDCLFSSIMQYLEYNHDNEMYEMPKNVTDLRQKIVGYVSHQSNWPRFVDTIIFNLENLLPDLQQDKYSDQFKINAYSRYMSRDYQYGTFAELQAASEIFDFVYVVFRKEKRRSERDGRRETWYNCYRSEDCKLKSQMCLLFSGAPASGHFQFMKPILTENGLVVPPGEYKTIDKYHATDPLYTIVTVRKIGDASSHKCHDCGIMYQRSK